MSIVVVKLGGEVLTPDALPDVAREIVALQQRWPTVVVHGGGAQTSALQRALGQSPRKVGGRRITDEATLGAVQMAVGGKLNMDLCAALLSAGAEPIGLNGTSSCVVEAQRRPPRRISGGGEELVDLGLVGDVVGVNRRLLQSLLDHGHLPVVACVGASRTGDIFNINGDVVATRLAAAVGAKALLFVSGVVGVLANAEDPGSRIAKLDAARGQAAIAEGIIHGGMIPKIEEAYAAIAAGVERVHIVGRPAPGALLSELDTPGSVGTVLLP